MLVLGWWLLPIALYRLFPLSLDAQAWRQLLPASSRPDVFSVIWMRWIRESVNAPLPVAGVGGDIASARLVHRRGVPGAKVAAAMVVDITVGVATQLIFVLSGVTLLAARSNAHAAVPVAWAMLTAVPLKTDFETRARKRQRMPGKMSPLSGFQIQLPQTSGKTREFAPLKGILVRSHRELFQFRRRLPSDDCHAGDWRHSAGRRAKCSL